MQTTTRLRIFFTWLAAWAMCFGAAAPTVSKLLASAAPGTLWVQLCSENGGTNAIAIPTDSANTDDSSSHPATGDDYCPYCALVHHLPFVPPALARYLPAAPAATSSYADAAIEVFQAHATPRAHAPRAPPSFA